MTGTAFLHGEFLRQLSLAFMVACGTGLVLMLPTYKLLVRLGSRQTVSQHLPEHQAKQGTPTMGGLLVLVAAAVALAVSGRQVLYELLGLALFGLIGFLDDFAAPRFLRMPRGLRWKPKLLLQLVAGALCTAGLAQGGEGGVWDRPWAIWAVAVFMVLFFCNAYNFADGLDGLAGSIGIGLAAGFAGLFLLSNPFGSAATVCGALAGGLVAFLFLNAPPAKVFMGDVGALPIGALFGILASKLCLSSPSTPYMVYPAQDQAFIWPPGASLQGWSAWAPAVILSGMMIVELVPVPLQILSVKLLKRRLFLRTPIHHAFEAKGIPESRIVWWFALVQVILAAGAVLLAYQLKPQFLAYP